MARTLVIGGGMAGTAAAISARAQGDSVTVLERNAKILKKLGVTGNGRGNLLNSGQPIYYGDTAFAEAVIRKMPYERLVNFWEKLGVPLREEGEGRIYPAALLASVAVDALRLKAEQMDIRICCHTQALSLAQENGVFIAEAQEAVLGVSAETIARKYRADRVIVTVGGAAAPAHGTDGKSYGLLTAFGHTLATPRPALCALFTEKKPIAGLEGQRVRAGLTLTGARGEVLHSANGEALFAKDGVSGIAAMQLARFARANCRLHMDLRPAIGAEAESWDVLSQRLRALAKAREDLPVSALLIGWMPRPLSRAIMSKAGIMGLERPMDTLAKGDFDRLACVLADFSLEVMGLRGFDNAQVTAGGIDPAQFDPMTLESRLCKGLYAAGEVLDVDGDCGGFNLMFALASGLIAGSAGSSPLDLTLA